MINENNPSAVESSRIPLEQAVTRMSDDLFMRAESAAQSESDEAEEEAEEEGEE